MNRVYTPDEKRRVVEAMDQGLSGPAAAAQAGLVLDESTPYEWRKRFRARGEAGLVDGRHGHRHKMTDAIAAWIHTTCQADPQVPSHILRDRIHDQFGITFSTSHLRRVRTDLGVRFVYPRKKNR